MGAVFVTDLQFCNLSGLRALLEVIEGAQLDGVEVAMRGMSRELSSLHRRYAAARTGGQLAHLPNEISAAHSPPEVVRSTSSV
jgi:hypothetical protein